MIPHHASRYGACDTQICEDLFVSAGQLLLERDVADLCQQIRRCKFAQPRPWRAGLGMAETIGDAAFALGTAEIGIGAVGAQE
jgi:hypothetical protein